MANNGEYPSLSGVHISQITKIKSYLLHFPQVRVYMSYKSSLLKL